MTHEFSTLNTLNKGTGIWIPTNRVIRPLYVAHWSAADHAVRQSAAVEGGVGTKSDYSEENYKSGFYILRENIRLQFEHKNIERSRPPLDSTHVDTKNSDARTLKMKITLIGVKTSYPNPPATESSACKEIAQKEYAPEDPESDTKTPATDSSAKK